MNLINQCFPSPYGISYVREIYRNNRRYSTIAELDGKPAGYVINKLM
jgi:hypothetical protein